TIEHRQLRYRSAQGSLRRYLRHQTSTQERNWLPSCIKNTLERPTRCSTQPARNDFQTTFTNHSLTSILKTKRPQKAKWVRSTSTSSTMLRILKSRISTWSCSLIQQAQATW